MSRSTLHQRLTALSASLEQAADEILAFDSDGSSALRGYADGVAKIAESVAVTQPATLLPPGQARVLTFIRQYMAQCGQAPTRAEIADALGFSSPNAAQDHLKRLDAKGVLTLTGSGPRAIRLNKRTVSTHDFEANPTR